VNTRVYDVRDLILSVDDAPPNEFAGADSDRQTGTSPSTTQPLSPRDQSIKLIIGTIQDTIGPDSWKDRGGSVGSIREIAGQLIVTQTPENQAAIERLLGQLRENRGLQVVVESRFLNVNPQDLAGISTKLRERLVAASRGSGIADSPQEFLSRDEVEPRFPNGSLALIDSETQREVRYQWSGNARQDYQSKLAHHNLEIRSFCHQSGIHYSLYVTDRDLRDFIFATLPAIGLFK